MSYYGDIAAGATLDFKFATARNSDGAPITLAGTPSLACYKDNSATQSTSGLTLSVDFDSVTGMHNVRVDTSADGSFYSAGSNFQVVLAAGTVDSVSVIGRVVGEFSIAHRPVQGLANDIITAAKFDESTAFPLTSADAGSTAVARTGADADTLETLSDQLDGAATSAALATAQADLDIITGTAGALIDAGTGAGQLSIASGLLAWNPAWDAEVQSEAADALVAYDPPTSTEATADKDEILAAVGTVDGNVDAIKAKTDSLVFTVAGQVDANVQYVNDVQVTGVGTEGDPWNPA